MDRNKDNHKATMICWIVIQWAMDNLENLIYTGLLDSVTKMVEKIKKVVLEGENENTD